MDKLVHIKNEDIASLGLNYIEDWARFNDMPRPYVEITEKQFNVYWDMYAWAYKDYRQVHKPEDLEKVGWKGYFSITIYFYNDVAYGRAHKFNGQENEYKYFRFGCAHEWETVEKSMCYWKGRCKKCGSISVVDSSD